MGAFEWRIIYESNVVKHDIPNLSPTIAKQIKKAVEAKLLTNPMHFSKPLQYSLKNQRRLRVGDYRVLFAIDHEEKLIKISSIDHRKDVYN